MAQTKQTIQIILINRSECSIVQAHLEQNNYIVVRVHESSSSESLWNGESLSRFCSIIVVFHLDLKFYAHKHFSCSNRYKKEYFLLLILDFKGIFALVSYPHRFSLSFNFHDVSVSRYPPSSCHCCCVNKLN